MSEFSLTYHYWGLGLHPVGSDGPVQPAIMTPGTAFEGEPNFDTEEYNGHTGVDTLLMEEDRTTSDTNPTWEQGMVLEEGQNAYFYMALGSYTKTLVTGATDSFEWEFFKDGVNQVSLPLATVMNGYGATTNDAIKYNNCMLKELELTWDDTGCKSKITMASAAPIIQQNNPARTRALNPTRLLKGKTRIFIASDTEPSLYDSLDDLSSIEKYEVTCFITNSLKLTNEATQSPCHGVVPQKQKPIEGKKVKDGSLEMLWNEESKKLYAEWYTGTSNGTDPNFVPIFKQILIVTDGKVLETVGGDEVRSSQVIYIPKTQISNVPLPLSGEDTKTLTVEHKVVTDGLTSPVFVRTVCNMVDLPWGAPF